MKDFVVKIFDSSDQFISSFMDGIVNKIVTFLQKGEYTLYAAIAIFLLIPLLIGLLRWIFRKPRLFLIFVVLYGIIFSLWFFFVK